jgi:tRNA modification GTPase
LRIAQGIKTVIVGETNVGKSTLLNALLRRDRAIVSDIPGTTRDTIEEDLSINGVLFRVIDTAGIRASRDAIEEMGIQRSLKAIEDADLLILLSDPEGDPGYLQKIDLEGKRVIRAANKSDIRQIDGAGYDVVISARTGQGLASLEKLMVEKTVDLTSIGEQIIVSARQRVCLQECLRYLHQSLEAIEERVTIDIVSTLVESAAKSLDDFWEGT